MKLVENFQNREQQANKSPGPKEAHWRIRAIVWKMSAVILQTFSADWRLLKRKQIKELNMSQLIRYMSQSRRRCGLDVRSGEENSTGWIGIQKMCRIGFILITLLLFLLYYLQLIEFRISNFLVFALNGCEICSRIQCMPWRFALA